MLISIKNIHISFINFNLKYTNYHNDIPMIRGQKTIGYICWGWGGWGGGVGVRINRILSFIDIFANTRMR